MFRDIVKEKIVSIKNKVIRILSTLKKSFMDFVKIFVSIYNENRDNTAILCWLGILNVLSLIGLFYISLELLTVCLIISLLVVFYIVIYSLIKYYQLSKKSLNDNDIFMGDNL